MYSRGARCDEIGHHDQGSVKGAAPLLCAVTMLRARCAATMLLIFGYHNAWVLLEKEGAVSARAPRVCADAVRVLHVCVL